MNHCLGLGFFAGVSLLMIVGCDKHKEPPKPPESVAKKSPPQQDAPPYGPVQPEGRNAEKQPHAQPVSSPTSIQPKQAAAPVVQTFDAQVARDVGRVYRLAFPLADPNRLREVVQQKRTLFAKNSVLIRCAKALGSKLTAQAVMSFAKSDYNGAYGRALEMGTTGEQARAVADGLQSGSLDMFTMGQELLWLAQVLPAAAEGDWKPFETTGTLSRQQIRQYLPFLQQMLAQDPAMAVVVDQAMVQCGPMIEEQIVWLAMMTGVCK